MTDIQALKDTMKESGIPMTVIAEKAGILRETLYNRLAGRGEFRASEIYSLSSVLHLTRDQRDAIFFAEKCE